MDGSRCQLRSSMPVADAFPRAWLAQSASIVDPGTRRGGSVLPADLAGSARSGIQGEESREHLPLRVMVVDDNDGFRESLVALLATGGHVVVGEATNGRQALDLVEDVRPDVVLMDIRMPVMDGIETTRRPKAMRADL